MFRKLYKKTRLIVVKYYKIAFNGKNIEIISTEQSAAKFQNVYFEKGSETRWIWVSSLKTDLRYSPLIGLSQFQAKESTEIDEEIISLIKSELKKQRIKNIENMELSKFKTILKKLKLNDYYEHIPYIKSQITGKPAPTISRETEEKLKKMFDQIQEPFDRHCPPDRINFLSYSYVLHKFCQLLELDDFIKCFPLLKSRQKLRAQDQIWKGICQDLKWQFYPSV